MFVLARDAQIGAILEAPLLVTADTQLSELLPHLPPPPIARLPYLLVIEGKRISGIVDLGATLYEHWREPSVRDLPLAHWINQPPVILAEKDLAADTIAVALQQAYPLPVVVVDDFALPLGVVTASGLTLLQKYQIRSLQSQIAYLKTEQAQGRSPQEIAQALQSQAAWSERHQIETALLDIRQRYATLVSLAPVGIFRTDLEGNCLYVNDRWCQMTGLALREAMGSGWMRCVHPEDRDYIGRSWYQAAQGQANFPFSLEFRFLREDGQIVWVVGEAVPEENRQGEKLGYIGTITNITSRKRAETALQQINGELEARVERRTLALRESEGRFRTIFEKSPIGMALIDFDQCFLQVNCALAEMLGHSPASLQQMKLLAMIHPDDRQEVEALTRDLFQGDCPSFQIQKRYLTAHGTIIWVNLTLTLIAQSQGIPFYGLALIQDITQAKATEERIQTSLQEKELLLKEVHHRVKNNLQVISSIFYLQSQSLADPKLLNLLEECQRRISSMSLIHEKLYQSENLTQVDFADYIRSLVSQLASSYSLSPHNIRWQLHLDPVSLPLDLAIPCGLLLNELVSNALKHAFIHPPYQGTITIAVKVMGDLLSLTVRDDGIGIKTSLLERAPASLGMRLIRALTRQLQGDLQGYNDRGAVFQVVFPAF